MPVGNTIWQVGHEVKRFSVSELFSRTVVYMGCRVSRPRQRRGLGTPTYETSGGTIRRYEFHSAKAGTHPAWRRDGPPAVGIIVRSAGLLTYHWVRYDLGGEGCR